MLREGELEYTLSGRSHHISVLREMQIEPLVQALYNRMAQAEAAEVAKVKAVYRALAQAAASGAQLDLNLEHSDDTAQQLKAGSKRRKSSSSSGSSSKSSKQNKRQR
eukprot:19360-Heterococcus_DN1.PRE.1